MSKIPRSPLPAPRSFNDADRRKFLNVLDVSHIEVSAWEACFIEATYDNTTFSYKQRHSIDQMIERYGEEIGF